MENIDVVNSNTNESNLEGNLRNLLSLSKQRLTPTPIEQENDTVEFSQQSLLLSQAVENSPEERVNPTPYAENVSQEDGFQYTKNPIREEIGNGIPNAPQPNDAPTIQTLPFGEADKEEIFQTNLTAFENNGSENNFIQTLNEGIMAFESTVPNSAEGTLEKESQINSIVENSNFENPIQNSIPIEEEMNQLNEITQVLNDTNEFSTAFDINNLENSNQNQRQVILQNVGTQLAQVVPPSNILSLLG